MADLTRPPGAREEEGTGYGHVVPMKILCGVWMALLVFTVVTVLVAKVDLGALNIWVALLVATVKASLVALYFMHLRWDSLFNGIVLMCALLFVAVFISIALLDTIEYQPDFVAPRGVVVTP